jgi:hypothetical protein
MFDPLKPEVHANKELGPHRKLGASPFYTRSICSVIRDIKLTAEGQHRSMRYVSRMQNF